MPRRKKVFINRKVTPIDERYENEVVERMIRKVMLDGKKYLASQIVYQAIDEIANKLKKEPMEALEIVMEKVTPEIEVRSRRIGGGNYQIPTEISENRKKSLAIRWLVTNARARKGMPMARKLAAEMVDAANDSGATFKKREDTHRMAEANKALAHYARY